MSRYRLLPTPAQEAVLQGHCAHARYIWNLAVEQHAHWHPGRAGAPGYLEQCRQLTQTRAEHAWLAAGSQMVQQQALRDFARAMAAFVDPRNPARRPTWRKAGRNEGFRIVGKRGQPWQVRRLSRKTSEVWVPKAGWVRFRWSRPVPEGVKSFRVTMDRAGRWHLALAAIPQPIPAPGCCSDPRPFRQERRCHRPADPAACAGYEHDPPVQASHGARPGLPARRLPVPAEIRMIFWN